MLAFLLIFLCGCLFLGLGIWCFASKKAVGFWANTRPFEVTDIKGYNRACGRLWIVYGLVLDTLGLSVLSEQNTALVLLALLGIPAASMALILTYVLKIEPKYRKK